MQSMRNYANADVLVGLEVPNPVEHLTGDIVLLQFVKYPQNFRGCQYT